MIQLGLEKAEVEQLLNALAKFPLEQVLGLFNKIQQQASVQLGDEESPVPESGE